MTYRELVYIVLDELKMVSDDSFFTEEHVIFLANHYRSFLLKQRYSDIRKEIPESNYQTICVDLVEDVGIACTDSHYLKSVEPIPHLMQIGTQSVTPMDIFQGNINYVNSDRFKYTGHNKWLKNQSYATIAHDSYLYIKSNNPQLYYLEKVKATGIFEDTTKVAKMQCPDSDMEIHCDIMDMKFPIEDSLISPLTELIVKELSAFKFQPQDSANDAQDDLADMATYIKHQLAEGRKSDLYKAL